MVQRAIYLRLMLMSLAIAAGFGVAAVLFMQEPGIWRISATAIMTAIVAGGMLQANNLAGKPNGRNAGNLAMGAVIAIFLLALVGIWYVGVRYSHAYGIPVKCWFTILAIIPCAIMAVGLLSRSHFPSMRIASPVGAALAGISFILFILAIWWPVANYVMGDTLSRTAWFGFLFSILATASLVGITPFSRFKSWRLVGVTASVGAFALTYEENFGHTGNRFTSFLIFTNLAMLIGYASIAVLVPLQPRQRWLRIGSIIAVAVAGGAVILDSLYPTHYQMNPLDRIISAAGILAACGTIALLVLYRMNRTGETQPASNLKIAELTVICPVCQKKSTLPLGKSNCPECGVQFTLQAEEPRCARCGYSLLMLKSGRCPECGQEVAGALSFSRADCSSTVGG